MHYSLYEGSQDTLQRRAAIFVTSLAEKNWLPAAAAAVMTLWVGLIFAAINQAGLLTPTSDTPVSSQPNKEQTLSVSSTSNTTPVASDIQLTAGETNIDASSNTQAAPATINTEQSAATVMATAEADEAPVIGGRGADEVTPPQPPAAPSVTIPPLVIPTVPDIISLPDDGSLLDGSLEVNLPLLPSIEVDLGLGMQ